MTLYIRGWGKDLIFQQQKVLMQQITHYCMLSHVLLRMLHAIICVNQRNKYINKSVTNDFAFLDGSP